MKATHTGTCQVCGHFQKLPSGRLSLHGYDVKWGFFNGVCSGSKHLPFEQDKSLIEAAIAGAQESARNLDAEAANIETNTDPDYVWNHEYRTGYRKAECGYFWTKIARADLRVFAADVRYEKKDNDGRVRSFNVCRGEAQWSENHEEYLGSIVTGAVLNEANKKYASHLRAQAKGCRQYIDWQKERIRDWKPQELKPVE